VFTDQRLEEWERRYFQQCVVSKGNGIFPFVGGAHGDLASTDHSPFA